MQKNRNNALVPIVAAVAVVVGAVLGMVGERGRQQTAMERQGLLYYITGGGRTSDGGKLGKAIGLIDRYYVDTVSTDSLVEIVLPEMLMQLDPHSVYIPARDLAELNEPLEGEFDGIGIVFNMATDTILVQNVVNGGPSDKAGMRAGDRILKINDSIVAGQKIDQNKIVKMLRGRRGTTVELDVQRPGIDDMVHFSVVRGIIPIKSLDAAFMLRPGLGYMKLSAFSRTSYAEVMSALEFLSRRGMDRLIFDLRGNSGGFLDQARNIANEFLHQGQLIVYTEDRNGERMVEYSDGNGKYQDLKIIMLVDEGSASSSEILAGAVQDNDRGLLIGRRTFGKGLVQRQFDLGDGSAIRLTIARYYTPTGRSIQKPYTPGDEESYAMDILTRYEHSELFSVDSIKFADSLKYYTPGGRVVYGGGGIMPDIFIPMDTTGMSGYYREVMGRNILYRYTIEYSDRHRDELDKITSVGQLNEFFDRDPGMLQDFIAYAARNGVPVDRAGIKESEGLIKAYLRAYIGRNSRLEDAGFYANIHTVDNTMQRAIEEAVDMLEQR